MHDCMCSIQVRSKPQRLWACQCVLQLPQLIPSVHHGFLRARQVLEHGRFLLVELQYD